MAAMAHYPLLLHRGAAERAVIICIGTGTTVGAVSTHHELQSSTRSTWRRRCSSSPGILCRSITAFTKTRRCARSRPMAAITCSAPATASM